MASVASNGIRGGIVLILQRVCVRRDQEPVVQHASLRVVSPGLLFVVGGGGAGKSSLLAMLASTGQSGLAHSGSAELDGMDICAGQVRAAWVSQQAHLPPDGSCEDALRALLGGSAGDLLQWLQGHGLDDVGQLLGCGLSALSRNQCRLLAVLAVLHADVPLYLVDEPTADLEPSQVAVVHECLRKLSQRAMVVVATHNRQDCLALGGHTALLAGGTIQECAPSRNFFSKPATHAGRTYVETGNCNLPRKNHQGRTQDGMWWLVPGLLCGMSRPGLMANADIQYQSLLLHGVRHLVCLEERCMYATEPLRELGIAHLHFPVPDMAPPGFGQAVDLCRAIENSVRNNEGVALHCRGGLGRTGTALAAILIWFGDAADAAIDKVRRAHPLAIQSMAQSRFLHEFADRIRGWHQRDTQPKECTDVPR